MNTRRIRRILLWLGGALGLYALVGFLVLPAVVKRQAIDYVERELGHRLELSEVRINPFTFSIEVQGFGLKEPGGGSLLGFSRLFLDFETTSLFRRAWTFAALELEAPTFNFERRPDGSHNFDALLARLRKEPPQPDAQSPRLLIQRIRVAGARIEFADLQAAPDARLRLDPIAFELTDLSTLPSESAPYSLTARSPEGEVITWSGDLVLNPVGSTGKLALQGWKVSTLDRLLGKRIGLQKAEGEISLSLDYRASVTQGRPSLVVSNAQMTVEALGLTGDENTAPLLGLRRFAFSGGSFDLARRTVGIERMEIAQAALDLIIEESGRGNWTALILQPLPPEAAAGTQAAQPQPAKTDAPDAADTGLWRIELAAVSATDLGIGFRDKRRGAATVASLARGRAKFAAVVEVGSKETSIVVNGLSTGAADIALAQGTTKLALGNAEFDAARIASKIAAEATRIDVETLATRLQSSVSQSGAQTFRIEAVNTTATSFAMTLPNAVDVAPDIEIAELALEAKGLGNRGTGGKEVVELKSIAFGARKLHAGGAGAAQTGVEDARATIEGALIRDPNSGIEIARIARLEASGANVSSVKRTVVLDRVLLNNASATTVLGSDGRSNWELLAAALLPPSTAAPTNGSENASAKSATGASPWTAAAKLIEVSKLSADFTDQRVQPAFSIAVQDVGARLRNATSAGRPPAALELSGRIKDSGRFEAKGTIDLSTYASDLAVKLEGISLVAVQPFIAAHARLQLVSAFASAEGRLRYGQPKTAGANLVYEGAAGLDKVIVEETEPAAPFLTLEALRANQIRFGLGPDGLDIPDLRLTRLATKLAIAEDQSINLVKVLRAPEPAKPAPQAAAAPGAAVPSATAARPAAPDNDIGFPIAIGRIRIDDSVLEFSDLGVRPQIFNTRMHELKGVITGVSTSRDSRARLELDARVDEFGAASIRGTMNPFKPRTFTSVDLDLRNIPMQTLTPYASKFAGYRIKSGTMTVVLEYRVKNSALQGHNKILLDKLELGERVDSPGALNLPLELAIAILKDADGRIDIGLPVSGSLDDPQFSVAALVWKALGNVLTRIVTAPFRALANLFGGGENDALGTIDFDPGSDDLRPPERQKLRTVAEALQKRPQLKIIVRPGYASTADGDALRSIALRREVLVRSGIKLAPGESPGPLDVGNPRTQQALDALFTERFGLPAARDLRASLLKSAPGAPSPSADADPKPAARPAILQSIRVARAMADRLLAAQPVTESDLATLAKRRGDAVLAEMRGGAKVDPARLSGGEPRQTEPKNGAIVTELDLSVTK